MLVFSVSNWLVCLTSVAYHQGRPFLSHAAVAAYDCDAGFLLAMVRVVRFAVPLPSLSRSIPPGRRARDAAPARILRVAVRGLRIHAARRHQPSVQRSARDKPGDLRVLVGHIRGTGSPLRGVAEGAVARAHTKPGTLLKPAELREVLHFLNGFVHSSDVLLFHHLRLRRSIHELANRVAESAAIEVPGSP